MIFWSKFTITKFQIPKTKQKLSQTEKIPFPEIIIGATPSPWGILQNKRITGKLGKDSPIAFSFSLPAIENPGTAEYLSLLPLHFYRFLEKESKKAHSGVRYASLDWHLEKNALSLLSTYGPFETRKETLAATLSLHDDGSIATLSLPKRKRSSKAVFS